MADRTRVPDEERFALKVDPNGPVPAHRPELGPCHIWTGNCDDSGYGLFYYHDESGKLRRTRAHRWLLGHLRGKPLTREVVGKEDGCHHCDNPSCVRREHLYVGTRKQNIADAVNRKRIWQLRTNTCPKGHPLDGVKAQKGKSRRYCKTCEKAGQRKHRTLNRTRCKNGHKLESGNVLLCKNGTRKCRICDAARLAKITPDMLARARAAKKPAA